MLTERRLVQEVELRVEVLHLGIFLLYDADDVVQQRLFPVRRLGVQQLETGGSKIIKTETGRRREDLLCCFTHQTQTLQAEAICCPPFAAVHVVSKRQDDLHAGDTHTQSYISWITLKSTPTKPDLYFCIGSTQTLPLL